MVSQGYALARAELLKTLVARTIITDADGAGTNDTLIASSLIGVDARKVVEKTILISSGDSEGEDAASVSFIPGTGEITVSPPFSHQILAGTIVRIINISTVELDVINILARLGTNADPAGTTTIFAWLAKIFGGLLGAQGLGYVGTVTAAVPGASFTIASLAGLGAGKFASTTQPPYRAYVLRDASGGIGGAPEGEMAAITGYTTASGLFTPNGPPGPFTVDIAAGDEVLILHPRIAEILDILTNLGPNAAAATADDLSDVTTTSAHAKLRRILLRMSGAGVFSADIQGAARTELDTMLAQLATYISAAGAAYSQTMNPGSAARTNIELALKDLSDILAGAGITTYPAGAAAADTVSIAEVVRYIQETLISGRMLFAMDFWSIPQTLLTVPAAGAVDQPLPNVVVANLPAGATIVKATVLFKFRMVENTGVANALNGDQYIQIQKGGVGGYVNALELVDDMFTLAAAPIREVGDVLIGDLNVVAKVSANDTYNFWWHNAKADVDSLLFDDVQVGIKILYSV